MAHMVKIEKGIYSLNGVVYGQKRIGSRLIRKKAPMQGALALNNRGVPTKECRDWYKKWSEGLVNEEWVASEEGRGARRKKPSLGELIEAYRKAAELERLEHDEPSAFTVTLGCQCFRRVMRLIGLKKTDCHTRMTPELLREAPAKYMLEGVARTSAWTTMGMAKCVFARWTKQRYEAMGLEVVVPAPWPLPKRSMAPQYVRPPEELRQKTLAWYRGLEAADPALWCAVTLMLELGMRNSDAGRLEWGNFRRQNGQWVLNYQPNKIKVRTGGRSITWPVADATYEKLRRFGGSERVLPGDSAKLYARVCDEMRALGWAKDRYSKGAYELRKLCIDAVYTKMGLEKAVQISGDNAATVSHYYLDPTRANLAAMPVEHLFEE